MTATTASRTLRLGGEALRFAAAGAVASGVDIALFWLATSGLALSPLVANPMSMAVRLAVAFWLTRVWVFPERRGRTVAAEAVGFLAVAALNVAGVEAALWLAVHAAGGDLSPTAATVVKVAAIVATFAVRFVLSRRVVFRA